MRARAVLVGWLAVVGVLALVAPATPAGAAGAITVTPNADLVDGQVVSVSITGFAPGTFLGVAQCVPGFGIDGCDTSLLNYTTVGADGSVSFVLPLFTILTTMSGTYDCRVDACVLGAGSSPDTIDAVFTPLAFDPDAPLMPPPVLTVDPSTDLVDGQQVDLRITGGRANASYLALQCRTGVAEPGGCAETGVWMSREEPDPGTAVATVLAVFRSRDGVEADCRVQACEMRLLRQGTGAETAVPLGFDPDAPLVTDPTVTLTPDSDLVDRQVVTVSGTGWPAGGYLSIEQCAVEIVGDPCRGSSVDYAPIPDGGTFSLTLTLDAGLYVGDGYVIDCRTAAGRCELRVTAYEDESSSAQRYAWVPLAFDPDAPFVPPPAVEVTPDTDLVDGQVVTVTATGLVDSSVGPIIDGVPPPPAPPADSPDGRKYTGSAVVVLCDADDPSTNGCGNNTFDWVEHDDGAFTTSYQVASAFRSGRGDVVDCREPTTSCELRVGQLGNPLRTTAVPLDFDPDAPFRAPPTITATPATDLADRDVVHVTGAGWGRNGAEVFLCAPGWVDGTDCQYLNHYLDPDDAGQIAADIVLRPVLRQSGGETFDCRTVPACDLVVGYPWTDEVDPDLPPVDQPMTASTPVSFDPDAPLVTPAVTGLSPEGPYGDGQIVTLHAEGLSAYTRYYIRQCRDAGELTGFVCDESTRIDSWADAAGTIAPWVIAHRTITVAGTEVDCAVDACVLLLDVPADGWSDTVAFPLSDGTTPPEPPPTTPPTTPPATTPTTTPSSTTTTAPRTTAATPVSATPAFTG